MWSRAVPLLMCFAMLGQPVRAQAPIEAQKPAAAPAKPSFLWEVRSDKGTLWLFGTVHVGKADFYPLPDAVESAFKRSAVLAVEADVSNQQAITEAAPLMLYTPPDSLDTKLPPPLLARLKQQLSRIGIPYEPIKSMRPFILAGLIAVTEYGKQGYDQSHGVDGHLIQRAILDGKSIVELEGVKAQMALLVGLSEADQEAFLDNGLVTLEKGRTEEQINALIFAWRSGDPDRLLKVVEDGNAGQRRVQELDEQLLYKRNRDMQVKIESMLVSGKTHFVAVGAMHLVGSRGLVAGLAAKGYKVNQR